MTAYTPSSDDTTIQKADEAERVPSVPRLARWLNRHVSPDKSAPDAFLRFHLWVYQKSRGRIGHGMIGGPCLVLTTTGRRTGEPRHAALVYAREGRSFVVAASNDARDNNPAWLLNLRTDPHVTLQIARRTVGATATIVESSDLSYARLWGLLNAVSDGRYDRYQARTLRPIPIVVFHTSSDSEPTDRVDHRVQPTRSPLRPGS
jgi:F420H(2)-dependent quinone reductase